MEIKIPNSIWEYSTIQIRKVEVKGLDIGQVDDFGEYYDEITQSCRVVPRKYIGFY